MLQYISKKINIQVFDLGKKKVLDRFDFYEDFIEIKEVILKIVDILFKYKLNFVNIFVYLVGSVIVNFGKFNLVCKFFFKENEKEFNY